MLFAVDAFRLLLILFFSVCRHNFGSNLTVQERAERYFTQFIFLVLNIFFGFAFRVASDILQLLFSNLDSTFAERYGISVSVNDFVIKAAALALKEVPEANGNDSLCTFLLLCSLCPLWGMISSFY